MIWCVDFMKLTSFFTAKLIIDKINWIQSILKMNGTKCLVWFALYRLDSTLFKNIILPSNGKKRKNCRNQLLLVEIGLIGGLFRRRCRCVQCLSFVTKCFVLLWNDWYGTNVIHFYLLNFLFFWNSRPVLQKDVTILNLILIHNWYACAIRLKWCL